MGQYYKALVKNDEIEKAFSPLDSHSGLKLTEHSYMGNHFVNGVIEVIENNPSRVAWVGDYADDEMDFTDLYTRHDYENVWVNRDVEDGKLNQEPEIHKDGYIVNHSKGLYIDIAHYMKMNDKYNDDEGWIVHPLPLLTAIGNGRGGGDYRGYNSNLVGTWATDLIEYSHEKPRIYTEFLPLFDPYA